MPQTDYELKFTEDAYLDMAELLNDNSKRAVAKAVVKSLKFMKVNLKHPSLHTHKYDDMEGPNGEEIFESYAQNNTPGAYRIFWFYGPGKKEITVVAITPHPD
ncbi:MAG: hypothetical protein LLG04_14485 [Parachlamydia sp.]|nr:hypothetical protein [Parachlamydia sp.]